MQLRSSPLDRRRRRPLDVVAGVDGTIVAVRFRSR
jgi:hypothetical protein